MPRLPHVEYSILWILHVLVGAMAGYALYGSARWDLVAASLVGIFFLSMLQHVIHVLSGASTTLKPEDYGGEWRLWKLAFIFGGLTAICTGYIVYYRPWALLGIIAGFIFIVLYAHPKVHLEELWGIGWAVGMNTAMYIASGKITLGPAILMAGIGYVAITALMVYRALTGDYDYGLVRLIADAKFMPLSEVSRKLDEVSRKRAKMLLRGIMSYIIAMILMIIGFALW